MKDQKKHDEGGRREDYCEFCHRVSLPVFVQPWYLDAVCAGGTWDVTLVRRDGTVIAAMPYFLKQKGPFHYLTLPPFVKHLGPYLEPSFQDLKHQHVLYRQLIEQLPSFHAFKQNFHPSVTNWLPFYWKGFSQTTRYTYRLDLKNPEALFAGLNRNMRRNLKKAGEVLNIVHHYNLREFYRLNQLSFQRQGLVIPYSFEQLQRHDDALGAQGRRQLFFAEDAEGKVHSAGYLIWDRDTAYYHLSGDDPSLRHSGGGILTTWAAIQYAQEALALETFDFEGSMLENIETIRRQFGACQVPYFYVWKYNSRLFRILDAGRQTS